MIHESFLSHRSIGQRTLAIAVSSGYIEVPHFNPMDIVWAHLISLH